MERRSFIKVSSLAAITVLTKSANGAAIEGFAQHSALPESTLHVRHGDYRLEKASRLFLPTWISFFKPHVFHENGISKGKKDLCIYSFEIDQKPFTAGVQDGNFYILGDEIYQTDSRDTCEIATIVRGINYRIQLIGNGQTNSIGNSEFVALVIDGKASFDSNQLSQHDLIHGKNIQKMDTSEDGILLVIGRN